jgi:CubicO group peptidase (beta-lactamase class C family)
MKTSPHASAVDRRTALAIGAGGLLAARPGHAAPVRDTGALARLLTDAVSRKVVPAVQLCVMRDDRLLFSRAAGFANLETGTPATTASIFRIGSTSKQFTAAAMLALAEDGRLSLEDKLARFIPEYPRSGEISLRQILSHTAGLGDYFSTKPPEAVFQLARIDRDDAAMLQFLLTSEPKYIAEPGTRHQYSNTGYVLAGIVLARASGISLRDLLQKRIFDRAKLAHTAFDDAPEIVPGRVSGYSPDAGAPSGFRNASFIAMSFAGGAGGVRSTAEDLCRWHTALFGGAVLSRSSVAQMLTPGITPVLKPGSGPDSGLRLLSEKGYGLGLALDAERGMPIVSHGGRVQGFTAQLATFQARRLTMALLVNNDDIGGTPALTELFEAIRKRVLADFGGE